MPREYQHQLKTALSERFDDLELIEEWNAFAGPDYRFQYSPRVDIAFGPYSNVPGGNQIENYNRLSADHDMNRFLRQIYDFHCQNIDLQQYDEVIIPPFLDVLRSNLNARCFLAIEIENNNSRKHTLGSIVNAASLGRVGIGIAYSNKAFNMFRRILNYLAFLRRVDKNTYDTTNFLIITREQMNEIMI